MRRVVLILVVLLMITSACGSDSEADETETALENIRTSNTIGECRSDFIGLEMTVVPSGWQCRLLDDPVTGLVGFTLFMEDNADGVEITIATPSPFGRPCDALVACDDVVELDVGTTFDVEVVEIGVPIIYGTHRTVDADLTVLVVNRLTHDDIAFITMILNGVEEI